MFDLQLQLFHASTKAASDLGDAYVTALKDAFEALPTEQAAEPQDSPSEATVSQADAAFELPKVPQPGGSWYRPPYENPVVAFWDELLKPWQAISPAGLQPGFQSAN
ncbi:MAG TPA: hypothetical protein VMX97_03530, partial [Hyphomicrobiaceae bacterium]|nr:hypothetical protein [Hyphomicrobiaceae bacterium]